MTKKLEIDLFIDEEKKRKPSGEEAAICKETNKTFFNMRKANVLYKKLLKMGGTPVLCGDCMCVSMIMTPKGKKPYLVSMLHLS